MMPREYPRGCIPPEYSLTQKEAAEFLGMSIRSLEQRCQRLKNRMPFVWFYQNSRIIKMFNRQELLEWQYNELKKDEQIEIIPFIIKRYLKGEVPSKYKSTSNDVCFVFEIPMRRLQKLGNTATNPIPHVVEVMGNITKRWYNIEEVSEWLENKKPQS